MFDIVIFDGDNVLEKRGPFTYDAAVQEAEWHVNHDGATRVQIVDVDEGVVLETIGETRRARV